MRGYTLQTGRCAFERQLTVFHLDLDGQDTAMSCSGLRVPTSQQPLSNDTRLSLDYLKYLKHSTRDAYIQIRKA